MLRSDRCSGYILELYDIRHFLADIDRGREFWRDGGGLVGQVLEYASTRFTEVLRLFYSDWTMDVAEYRARGLRTALQVK